MQRVETITYKRDSITVIPITKGGLIGSRILLRDEGVGSERDEHFIKARVVEQHGKMIRARLGWFRYTWIDLENPGENLWIKLVSII